MSRLAENGGTKSTCFKRREVHQMSGGSSHEPTVKHKVKQRLKTRKQLFFVFNIAAERAVSGL